MTPTARLRFIWRSDKVVLNGEEFDNHQRILQQWWEAEGWEHPDTVSAGGRWEDVPTEDEGESK